MKHKELFEKAVGNGLLAMSGSAAIDGGAALAMSGVFLAFRQEFGDRGERAVRQAVKRAAKQARDDLVLFYRKEGEAGDIILAENDARRVIMEQLADAMPSRSRIVATAFDIDTLAAETLARLGEGTNRLDLANAEQHAIADAHVRAVLSALEAERDFVAHLDPFMGLEIARDVKALRKQLAALEAQLAAAADPVAAEQDVPPRTLRTIARTFDQRLSGEYSKQDLIDFLQDKALEYRDLSGRIGRGLNIAPEITRLRTEAKDRLDAGDFDAARSLLKQAREKQTALRQEQEAEAAQRRAEEVELLTEEAGAAELALDYGAAGDAYLQAVDLLKQDDPDAAAALAFKAADGFDEDAQRLGDNAGMERAIALYEARLSLKPKAQDSTAWASAQNNLGAVLRKLGERRGDEAILQRAVDAYDAALTVYTPDAAPVAWATTQNNLGVVLKVLGERSGD